MHNGTVVTVHNCIMLVHIPSKERLRNFDEILDVIKNLVNDIGNLSHCISGLASCKKWI
jgi:hypothetical protein